MTTLVDLDDVESVYEGERDRCCCGCSGDHTTVADEREEAERIVDTINDLLAAGQLDLEIPDELVSVHDGGTVYIAYFKSDRKRESNAQ